MKALWNKQIIADMIRDGAIVTRATVYGNADMIQLELKKPIGKHEIREPFPGLTDQAAELLHGDAVTGILNLVADKQSYLVDIILQRDESTHEEEVKP